MTDETTDGDALDRDPSDRYPDGETPEVPPTERDAFDPPTDEWANYWDVGAIAHGATFIQYDPDKGAWTVIEVTPPSAWPENAHIIERQTFYHDNVWTDPDDPLTDFTDAIKSELRSLHRSGDELPNAPEFLENVTYYVAGLTHRFRSERQDTFTVTDENGEFTEDTVSDYWDELRSWGVDPEDVTGVADDQLPDSITDD